MEIMAAGVGFRTGGAGKVQAGFFGHGQGVHISTQQNALAALTDGSADTVTAGLSIDAQLVKFFQHIGLALGHIQADFGVDVKKTAMDNGFFLQGQCSFVIIHNIGSFLLKQQMNCSKI